MIYQRLSQEELENRINATRAYIRRQQKRNEESRGSEVDLCYLEREEEFREKAREIHQEYLAKIERVRREEERMRHEEEEALRESEGEEEEDFYE